MIVERLAAFCDGVVGGNPAGVVIADRHPECAEMQRVAAEVGYSETVFAAPEDDGLRVRYFAPAAEVPFCGHATIALGALLASRGKAGHFRLRLNKGAIGIDAWLDGDQMGAALQSPPACSSPASASLVERALHLFGYHADDLDPRLAPAIANAGNDHLIIALASRSDLARMAYDLEEGRTLMVAARLTTIALVHAESQRLFHARNPFASGGVYEDPATGSAAAALGGWLHTLGWAASGAIDIVQGEDMGMRSRIRVDIPDRIEGGLRVSGRARFL